MKREMVAYLRGVLSLVLLGFATAASADLNSGLVAYFPFDGNVEEVTGLSNDGINNGSTSVADRFGVSDHARHFTGGQYVTVPRSSAIEPAAAITVALWARLTDPSYPGQLPIICKRYNVGSPLYNSYILQPDNPSLKIMGGVIAGGSPTGVTASATMQAYIWSHLALTYDGANLKVYKDGQLVAQCPTTGTLDYSSDNLYIGMSTPARPEQHWEGDIDDVRIYNRALSAQEVQELYGQVPAICDDFSTDTTANYNAIYWQYYGASATPSILYDAPNQRAIVQGVGGYGNIVMEKNGESPISAGSDFTFSADVSILSEFNGYLYLGDNRPIPPVGGTGTGVRFNIGTFSGYNADLMMYQNGVNTDLRTPYTPLSINNLRITRVNGEYSFYVNNNLFWTQAIPALDGMALYWGVGNEISSGPSGITAQTAFDNICVTSTGAPRRPVVVIPGIGGSFLNHSSKAWVWPLDAVTFIVPTIYGDPRNLQFTQSGQPRTDTLSSSLAANSFIPYEINGLKNFLLMSGYEEGVTLFEFPYDFRKSVSDQANALATRIQEIVSTTGASKVDIVAHSMGGLLAKQYLANSANAARVGTLIMIGTPQLGTPKALKALRYGEDFNLNLRDYLPTWNVGLDPCKVKRAGHNMPGLFNLLPGRNYFNVLGGYYEDAADIDGDGTRGLLNFDQTVYNLKNGVEDLLDHCPLQAGDPAPMKTLGSSLVDTEMVGFHDSLDGWQKPDGVNVFAIVGHGVNTITKIKESSFWGLRQVSPIPSCFGDGTVPLRSADSVAADEIYYVYASSLGVSHNSMVGNSDVEKQIFGLLSSGRGVYGNPNFISTTRPSFCPRTSTITVYSPVRLGVFDSQGRHTGLLPDGSTESAIAGSSVELFGESQSVIVPEGDSYLIVVEGIGNGTFGLEQTDADAAGNELQSMKWEAVPVTVGSQDTMLTAFGAVNPVLNVDTNADGVIDYSLPPDADGDRVPDVIDQCPDTPLGAIVNSHGCSIPQLVPCDGPASGGKWKSHGQYVQAVVQAATGFLRAKLITRRQWMEIVTRAAWSKCGWSRRCDHDWDWDWHRNWDCDRDRDWGRGRCWDRD